MEINQGRGLTAIPAKVGRRLPGDMKAALANHGHGISFPDPSGCQMRMVVQGEDKGGFYSYLQYGSPRKAVEAAMSRYLALKLIYGERQRPIIHDGLHRRAYFHKRNQRYEYRWQVHWQKDYVRKSKTFHMTSGHEPTPEQDLHAFQTAKAWRRMLVEHQGHQPWMDELFRNWRHIRLYANNEPFNWEQQQERAKHETAAF